MLDVFLSFIKQPAFNNEEYLKAWIIRATINKSKHLLKAIKKRKRMALDVVKTL
jgi:DNA-directed RNA polymerase specialized sigma24 family protein